MHTIKHDGKQYKVRQPHQVTWDDEKDNELIVLRKAEKPVNVIAKCFGYSPGVIRSRMKILKLTDDPWTTSQDKILRENYLTHTNKELARMVGSNYLYVADRLDYLGLGRPVVGK